MRRSSAPSQVAKKAKYARKTPKTSTASLYRSIVSVGSHGFPPRLSNKMRYAQTFQIVNAGAILPYVFSCNGLYDPDTTGTGHQPHYFDQLTQIYNHYTVTRSTMTVRQWTPQTAAGSIAADGMMYGIFIDDDATPSITGNFDGIEREGCVWSTFHYSNIAAEPLTKVWNSKVTFGPNIQNNPNFQGDSSSNPAEQSHFVFWQSGTSTQACYWVALIEYEVTWTELKSVAAS